MHNQPTLSSFRSRFFPVYNHELLGFFLLSCCFFCIALEYAALRGCKDTLVLCLKEGGGEAVAASKVFVILFMILFKIMYDFIGRYVSRYHRFNYVFGYFIVFFLFTVFVLYPNRENWQIITLTEKLNHTYLLDRFWPIWLMVRHWPVTLIYMHAEGLGTFGLSVSLWGIVNYISTIDQSKRIYPLFSLSAGLGTWVAGTLLKSNELFSIENIFQICIASFVVLLVIYNLLIAVVKSRPDVYVIPNQPKKKKVRLGLKESFAVLFKSRYFTGITLLVLGYAMSTVLFENIYRNSLKAIVGVDEGLIRKWTSSQLQYVGIGQIICVWLSPYIMRQKWEFGASLVPKIMLMGVCIFFGLLFFGENLFMLEAKQLGYVITISGLAIIVMIKVQKYLSFDVTKERLYIVVNDHDKAIGKSAVDGVGSRFGKGFSAMLITFVITPICGSIADAKYVICFLLFAIILTWLWAVKDVGKQFNARLKASAENNQLAQSINKV